MKGVHQPAPQMNSTKSPTPVIVVNTRLDHRNTPHCPHVYLHANTPWPNDQGTHGVLLTYQEARELASAIFHFARCIRDGNITQDSFYLTRSP